MKGSITIGIGISILIVSLILGFNIGIKVNNKEFWKSKEALDTLKQLHHYKQEFLKCNGQLIKVNDSFLWQDFVRKHSTEESSSN